MKVVLKIHLFAYSGFTMSLNHYFAVILPWQSKYHFTPLLYSFILFGFYRELDYEKHTAFFSRCPVNPALLSEWQFYCLWLVTLILATPSRYLLWTAVCGEQLQWVSCLSIIAWSTNLDGYQIRLATMPMMASKLALLGNNPCTRLFSKWFLAASCRRRPSLIVCLSCTTDIIA